MASLDIIGQIISGGFGQILVRQKNNENLELGELLVADSAEQNAYTVFQVHNLKYGSQIEDKVMEFVSGMKLEGHGDSLEFIEPELRNYVLAELKAVLFVMDGKVFLPKTLPKFFSHIRRIKPADLDIFSKSSNPLFLGNVRSGSKELELAIPLDGAEVFRHHILVPATTGRGKSNLVKTIIWNAMNENYCSMLVLDPHDEYYGRTAVGLKDHPRAAEKLSYYSPRECIGNISLKINISAIKPYHFNGAVNFSEAQQQVLYAYWNKYRDKWIESVLNKEDLDVRFQEESVDVVIRRLVQVLDLRISETGSFIPEGIFDFNSGEATLKGIVNSISRGKIVVVDTSSLYGSQEILVSSIIANEIFEKYKYAKHNGNLEDMPLVSIILEEAPRVLGKDALVSGPNVFSTIAREGRKFKTGLLAITQLPSLIPREILANMNTKIVLGLETAPERQAIIDSAAQDLSSDSQNIASLDKGEAIVTSNFTKFAMPIKIPLFEEVVAKSSEQKRLAVKQKFSGMN